MNMGFSSFIVVTLLIPYLMLINCEISHLRLCGDPKCKDPISEGITLIHYIRGDEGLISFKKNTKVVIYSKSAVVDAKEELWEGEIDGRRGFLPRRFVRETRILNRRLEFKVPVNIENDSSVVTIKNKNDDEFELEQTLDSASVMTEIRTTLTETTSSDTDVASNEISSTVSEDLAVDKTASSQTLAAGVMPIEANTSSIDDAVRSDAAVWFPERDVSKTTRSGSFFPSFGVSADSSVGEKEPASDVREYDGNKGEEISVDGVKYAYVDGSTILVDDLAVESSTLLPSQTDQSSVSYAATPTLVQSSSDAPTLMKPSSVVDSSRPTESLKIDRGLFGDIFEYVKGEVKEFMKNSNKRVRDNSDLNLNRKSIEVESDGEVSNFASSDNTQIETESSPILVSKDLSEEGIMESRIPLDAKPVVSNPGSHDKQVSKDVSEEKTAPKHVPDEMTVPKHASDKVTVPKDVSDAMTLPKDVSEEISVGLPKDLSDETVVPIDLSDKKMVPNSLSDEKTISNVLLDAKLGSKDLSKQKTETIEAPEAAEMKSNVTSESITYTPHSTSNTLSNEDDGDEEEEEEEDTEDDTEDLEDDPADEEDEEETVIAKESGINANIVELSGEKSYFKDPGTDEPPFSDNNDATASNGKTVDKEIDRGVDESSAAADVANVPVIPSKDTSTSAANDVQQTEVEEGVTGSADKVLLDVNSAENKTDDSNEATDKDEASIVSFNDTVDSDASKENSARGIDLADDADTDVNVTREVETIEDYDREPEEKVFASTASLFNHEWVNSAEEVSTESTSLPIIEQIRGSCDAATGFDGSCPNPSVDGLTNEKGNIEASAESELPSVEETDSVDYAQLALIYLWVLRDTTQFVIDCLPEPVHTFLVNLEEAAVSPRVVVFTVIVGVFILLLQISIVSITKRRKERDLLRKLCNLDKVYFVVVKERDELKEKLDNFNHNVTSWKADIAGAQSVVTSMQLELESSKSECQTLRAQVASLEEQLEMSTDAGLELNSMLSEFLTSQRDGGKLQEAVERLQEQLESQRGRLADLQLSSEATNLENRRLRTELETCIETNVQLGAQLEKTVAELKDFEAANEEHTSGICERDECIEKLQITSDQLLKEAEVWNESVKELQGQLVLYESKLTAANESLDLKSRELEIVKEEVGKLRTIKRNSKDDGTVETDDADGDVWQSLLDVSSLKSNLQAVTKERDELSCQLQREIEARRDADDLSRRAVDDSEVLRREYESAHQEREEAMKKLEILSTYFKEKEMQLQKELGLQEAIRQQSQENVTSVSMKMNLFEQEVELYKSQISSLKAEIMSLERSYKNQIASHEKKAHENWLAARAAERKLEESKQEAAVLRNKLTLLEQEKSNNQNDTTQKYVRSNGEVPSPPRLGPSDRYDSMDLPTSSRSSLFRESIDFPNGVGLPFLPVDRPLPPPFLRGLPPPPPNLLPPSLMRPPFDDRGPLPPPPSPFDPRRPLPPEQWMALPLRRRPVSPSSYSRDRPSPPSSNASQQNHLPSPPPPPYDRRQNLSRNTFSPPSDIDQGYNRPPHEDRGNPRAYESPLQMGWRGPPPGVRQLPPHMRRDIYPPGQSDGRIDPRTSSPINRTQTDDRDTAGV